MWDQTFYIGTDLEPENFKKLSTILFNYNMPVNPDWTFSKFASYHEDLDGNLTGIGLPVATWKWAHRNNAHIETLRLLIPNPSATLFVRTPITEADDTSKRAIFRTFQTIALWAEEEDMQGVTSLNFSLRFRKMVIQEEEE